MHSHTYEDEGETMTDYRIVTDGHYTNPKYPVLEFWNEQISSWCYLGQYATHRHAAEAQAAIEQDWPVEAFWVGLRLYRGRISANHRHAFDDRVVELC